MKKIYLSPPHMSGNELEYIKDVFKDNWIAPIGPHLNMFEDIVKEYTGAKHAVAVTSCTAGIHLALRALRVKEGDYVLIHDTGAYTLSMWSRYNSRQVPKVVGYYDEGEKFEILKERESLDDVLNFWE